MPLGQTVSTCHLSHDTNRPPHEALVFNKSQPVTVNTKVLVKLNTNVLKCQCCGIEQQGSGTL